MKVDIFIKAEAEGPRLRKKWASYILKAGEASAGDEFIFYGNEYEALLEALSRAAARMKDGSGAEVTIHCFHDQIQSGIYHLKKWESEGYDTRMSAKSVKAWKQIGAKLARLNLSVVSR